MSGGAVTDDLQYLLLYWLATLLSAGAAQLTRLSPLVFYLIFGMILSNAQIVHPTPFLTSFSEFAITVVFFALGFEENVRHFMEGIRKAWGIASIGAIVPFLIGFSCTIAFWPGIDVKAALMGGLAVTATAVSLTMIALKSEGLATSKPAIGVMTSAVLDDIASLALVAVCVPIATGEADPTVPGICWIMAKACLFFLCIAVAHLIVFPHDVERGPIASIPGIRAYGLKHVLSFHSGEQATMISLSVGLFFGMVAVWWGFHPAIGAYMAGLIMEEPYFELPFGDGNTYQHTHHNIEDAAFNWLGPVFFVNLGATIIIDAEVLRDTILYSVLFFVALYIGQFGSATFAARFVPGGFTWSESAMIGFGMLGRAELFFVVLKICYTDNQIFTRDMFFTFAITAMLLNISVPISITLFKPYYERSQGTDDASVMEMQMSDKEESTTDIINKWVNNKAHRSTIKKERRIFKADPEEALAKEEARVSSRASSKDLDYLNTSTGEALRNSSKGELRNSSKGELRNSSKGELRNSSKGELRSASKGGRSVSSVTSGPATGDFSLPGAPEQLT